MKSIAASLPFAGLTVLCWGSYGPILHASKGSMGNNSWAQLLCVGVAYFLIAVIIPVFILRTKGEQGQWTKDGFLFGLGAGTFGALGALGIITALTSGGDPIYVMPLVFGGAPVVNTLVSMWIGKLFGKASNGFYLGIILVAVGAAGVFITKPSPPPDSVKELTSVVMVMLGIALTVFCWGSYGTVLHKSQAKMGGSRLRPLFCVGLAYFLIAIIVPLLILSRTGAPDWHISGAFGSLAAGACGAIGALGIILSFTFGGKPVFVMPLVFGGAPVINTLIEVAKKGTGGDSWGWFMVSLTLVIVGAITTLVCAPKTGPGNPHGNDDGDADSPPPEDDPVRREGVIDPTLDTASREAHRSIDSHLSDYEHNMRASNPTDNHVRQTVETIRKIANWAEFITASNITADGVNQYAAKMHDDGLSLRTIQAHLTAIKGFTRWLADHHKLPRDPLVPKGWLDGFGDIPGTVVKALEQSFGEEEEEEDVAPISSSQEAEPDSEEVEVDDSAFEKDVEDIGAAVTETLDELKSILDDSTDEPDPAGDDADEEPDQEKQHADS